jgi:hypothetical protein
MTEVRAFGSARHRRASGVSVEPATSRTRTSHMHCARKI